MDLDKFEMLKQAVREAAKMGSVKGEALLRGLSGGALKDEVARARAEVREDDKRRLRLLYDAEYAKLTRQLAGRLEGAKPEEVMEKTLEFMLQQIALTKALGVQQGGKT